MLYIKQLFSICYQTLISNRASEYITTQGKETPEHVFKIHLALNRTDVPQENIDPPSKSFFSTSSTFFSSNCVGPESVISPSS